MYYSFYYIARVYTQECYNTDMEQPKTDSTLQEQIAHWDVQRQLCLDGLVYATNQRIACSRELNEQPRVPQSDTLDHLQDPAYLDSFTS